MSLKEQEFHCICYNMTSSSANLCVTVLDNSMMEIYRKNTTLTIRSSEVQGLTHEFRCQKFVLRSTC